MQPPQVQSVQSIYDNLNSTYDPQRQNINQQIGNVQNTYGSQLQGLQQQKTNAFNDIQGQANNNGMFYSGVTPSEEMKYTGGTYLPAVANLEGNINQQKYGLQSQYNTLGQQQQQQAYGTNATQAANYNQYQQNQQQLAMQQAQNQAMLNMYSHMYGGGGGGGGGGGAVASQTAAQPTQNTWNNDFSTLAASVKKGFAALNAGQDYKSLMPTLPQAISRVQQTYGNNPAYIQAVQQLYARHGG